MNELENDQTLNEKNVAEDPVSEEPIILDAGPEIDMPPDALGTVTLEPDDEVPQPESKTRAFFRKLFRWTLGILIILGIGFTLAVYRLYTPAVETQELTLRELDDAQNQIADLETQISMLQSAALESDAKLAVKSNFELHVAVLSARVDVANASLMIVEDNAAGALLALEKTDETLALIKSLLPVEQGDVVTAMEQRLELVLTEIVENSYAAGSDLNVLATSLLQLEDATFGSR